ncbi:hexon [Carex rostrata]
MPHPTKLANSSSNANGNANSTATPVIKVGSTGTVASLMSRELENIKITQVTPQDAAASSSNANTRRKKYQSSPVSVPCGANPKKIVIPQKSNLSKEEADKLPRSVRKNNGRDAPMLSGDCAGTDQNSNPSFAKSGKKGHLNAVEVVDLKCTNPMSSRLRKLGFSKLSESIA